MKEPEATTTPTAPLLLEQVEVAEPTGQRVFTEIHPPQGYALFGWHGRDTCSRATLLWARLPAPDLASTLALKLMDMTKKKKDTPRAFCPAAPLEECTPSMDDPNVCAACGGARDSSDDYSPKEGPT